MRCGKNRTLFDFLPARQITRAGSASMEMIHGFNSLSAALLLNIFLSFEVGIAHAIANFK